LALIALGGSGAWIGNLAKSARYRKCAPLRDTPLPREVLVYRLLVARLGAAYHACSQFTVAL